MSIQIEAISSHSSKLLKLEQQMTELLALRRAYVCSMLNAVGQRVPDGAFIQLRICPPRSGQVGYRARQKRVTDDLSALPKGHGQLGW